MSKCGRAKDTIPSLRRISDTVKASHLNPIRSLKVTTLPNPVNTSRAEYRLIEITLPGRGAEVCGVVLWDPGSGRIGFRMRRDWDDFAPGEDAEVLREIAADLPDKAAELGAEGFFAWVDDRLSNTVRFSAPDSTLMDRFESTLSRLYRRHVAATVRPFATHLPVRAIRAAAGGFGKDTEDEQTGWVEVPENLRLSKDMFVIRIEGRSMEPEIPAGSLCVFKPYRGGSRRGKIVLVQRIGASESGGEVTIKRYDSEKEETAEGDWRHRNIRMNPENPEYEAWDLREADRYVTVAEFVAVIEGSNA